MPEFFELSQTIPASEIEPGTYRVSCMMWMEENKKTSGRLFANNNVQYYGYESDYTRLLTPGEINTYAGYAGQNGGGPFNLMPMEVYVRWRRAKTSRSAYALETGATTERRLQTTPDGSRLTTSA